jgi:3-hydroxy-9,10-secoandrosta-1,3,5(10)-triene-9,17-dione monooxygenase reductase component
MITQSVPFEPRELRNAFGSFGTGVTVVTARQSFGRQVGVTANSFSSVSLHPPIVSWNLVKTSPSLDVFDAAGRFVINILSVEQLPLSRQFSSRMVDKFSGVDFHHGLDDQPVLDHCTATIECKTVSRHEVGDHVLFLGEVERFSYRALAPLLFCQGRYLHGHELQMTPN